MSRVCGALAAALLCAACGSPRMTLPSGPGAAAADAADLLASATERCRSIQSISLEVGISGRVGGQRLRARMLAGLAAPSSAYLDIPAPFGASAFILGTTGDQASLLLPRDRRVLSPARPADVLEAIAGVFLDAADLRHVLTGCAALDGSPPGRQFGDDWRVASGANAEAYLHREKPDAPWRLIAVVHRPAGRPGWRAEYRDFEGSFPRAVRLISEEEGRFDLRLTLSQVEIDPPLPPSTFQIAIPAGFTPLTLQELRDAGPLAERRR